MFTPGKEYNLFEILQKADNGDLEAMETDDYYWKACFRLAKAYHYGLGIERSLDRAVELMAKAKNLYEARGNEVCDGDITREEFYREWLLLNQDAGAF